MSTMDRRERVERAIGFRRPDRVPGVFWNRDQTDGDVMLDQGTTISKPGMKSEGAMFLTMDPVKGRNLFASKGCVVCHAVNGIGGEDAPPLDAANMPSPMNPFDFAAKMWMGAGAMIMMQEDELGEQIEFTGEELANIIAFVHDAEEQKKFSQANIPQRITKLMDRAEKESD